MGLSRSGAQGGQVTGSWRGTIYGSLCLLSPLIMLSLERNLNMSIAILTRPSSHQHFAAIVMAAMLRLLMNSYLALSLYVINFHVTLLTI